MPLPPRPTRDQTIDVVPLSTLPSEGERATAEASRSGADRTRLELDPAAAELISRAIAAAFSSEVERVRASLSPPASSTPRRSSIRVAAGGASQVGKVGTMAIGAIALIGQCIVWFGRPEYAAPISQAFKLLSLLFGGGSAPAP